MDGSIYLGFAALELSKLLLYQTYNDEIRPIFRGKSIQLHYKNTDSVLLSVDTNAIVKDLQNLNNFFYFGNLNNNHELFSDTAKKQEETL